MERQQAIEEYSKIKLRELSLIERAEQLEVMTLEDWSDTEGWSSLPKSIQDEIENGEEIHNPELEKYDAVLMIWLKNGLLSVTNKFLCEKLSIDKIVGEPVQLKPCPCCGYLTMDNQNLLTPVLNRKLVTSSL